MKLLLEILLGIVAYIVASLLFTFFLVVLLSRARGAGEDRDDEMAAVRSAGATVPDVDGCHESLPEDKETSAAFWALAKTAGIGVKQ